jgi:hypothetical protein
MYAYQQKYFEALALSYVSAANGFAELRLRAMIH